VQVKRKHGLDVREHYNISKNENQKVPQCPIEKKSYFGYFEVF
jgi:RNA methyltransferase, trmA family